MIISENIKRIRKERGITQKKLGELCGIAEPNIRKYENGKQIPRVETIEKIASALRVTPFDLMGFDYWDQKNPNAEREYSAHEGILKYLESLGYKVDDSGITNQGGNYILTKDGLPIPLSSEEFQRLQIATQDVIAFILWKKAQENK